MELLTLKFFQPMMMLRKAPTVAAALTSSMMALQEDGRERGEGGILVGNEKPLPAFAGQEVVGEQNNLLAPISGCACWTVTVMWHALPVAGSTVPLQTPEYSSVQSIQECPSAHHTMIVRFLSRRRGL